MCVLLETPGTRWYNSGNGGCAFSGRVAKLCRKGESPAPDNGEKRMKKEWTEQDLRAFAENAQTAFEDVTLTEADEEAADTWQDDGLQVDYVLRNGQVDCVLRRLIEADGKLWQLQMTAPLAGSDLPEDRMTARERELCRDDMNHDFLTGVFNRRYFETEFCTRLDEWTDAHRCASLALVALDDEDGMRSRQGDAVMNQLVCFVANQWKKYYDRPAERVVCRLTDTLFAIGCADKNCAELAEELNGIYAEMPRACVASVGLMIQRVPVHRLRLHRRGAGQELGRAVSAV